MINCPLKDIKAAYEKIFTERLKSDLKDQLVNQELNDRISSYKNQDHETLEIDPVEFKTIIDSLSNAMELVASQMK